MTDFTTPSTRSNNFLVDEDVYNDEIINNIKHLHEAINSVVIIEERQTQGTNGGTFTSGAWQTRALNTEVIDPNGICSLSSNQITLDAGTYEVEWWAVGLGCEEHQTRLQNVTDASTVENGSSVSSRNQDTGTDTVNVSTLSCGGDRFTIAAGKALELQHRCTQTKTTDGFGRAVNVTGEVYAWIKFRKVA